MPTIERLWTVEDVSKYLGVSAQTIYGWRCEGSYGPPGRKIGKHLRFVPQDVREWVLDQSTEVV